MGNLNHLTNSSLVYFTFGQGLTFSPIHVDTATGSEYTVALVNILVFPAYYYKFISVISEQGFVFVF